MGFKDWLSDTFDRVANFRTDRHIARQRDKLVRRYGFTPGHSMDEFGPHGDLRDQVRQLHAENRLTEFEPMFRAARKADVTLPNGLLLHEALTAQIMSFEDERAAAIEEKLAPFRQGLQERPSPFQAALLARALCFAAYAHRGSEIDGNWDGFDICMREALATLAAHPDPDGQCPIRAQVRYELAMGKIDGAGDPIHAFEQAWQLDRYNLSICERHGVFLLPRWIGRGARDLEGFARHAAAQTKDRYGMGAYAFIYSFHPQIGSHDAGDTLCDPALLRQGFDDLIARFDGQSLLNRYATTMDWIGDHETTYRLFHDRIRVITRDIWAGDTADEQMEDALEAFIAARYARADERDDRKHRDHVS